MKTAKRPKSSKVGTSALDHLNADVPGSIEKHPSEINILSLNRNNVLGRMNSISPHLEVEHRVSEVVLTTRKKPFRFL